MRDYVFDYREYGGGLVPVAQIPTCEIKELLQIDCIIDPLLDGEMTTQEDVHEPLRIELLIRGMKL